VGWGGGWGVGGGGWGVGVGGVMPPLVHPVAWPGDVLAARHPLVGGRFSPPFATAVFPSSVHCSVDAAAAMQPRGIEVGDIVIAVNCESVAGKVWHPPPPPTHTRTLTLPFYAHACALGAPTRLTPQPYAVFLFCFCLLCLCLHPQTVREVAQMMLCGPARSGVLVRVAREDGREPVAPGPTVTVAPHDLSLMVTRRLSPTAGQIAAARAAAAASSATASGGGSGVGKRPASPAAAPATSSSPRSVQALLVTQAPVAPAQRVRATTPKRPTPTVASRVLAVSPAAPGSGKGMAATAAAAGPTPPSATRRKSTIPSHIVPPRPSPGPPKVFVAPFGAHARAAAPAPAFRGMVPTTTDQDEDPTPLAPAETLRAAPAAAPVAASVPAPAPAAPELEPAPAPTPEVSSAVPVPAVAQAPAPAPAPEVGALDMPEAGAAVAPEVGVVAAAVVTGPGAGLGPSAAATAPGSSSDLEAAAPVPGVESVSVAPPSDGAMTPPSDDAEVAAAPVTSSSPDAVDDTEALADGVGAAPSVSVEVGQPAAGTSSGPVVLAVADLPEDQQHLVSLLEGTAEMDGDEGEVDVVFDDDDDLDLPDTGELLQ
jgi:hypothetical protein